jgi:hypothetical protein
MVTKGTPVVKNLFFGGLYVDLRGTIEAISHTTGCKIQVKLIERDSISDKCRIEGECFDP